MWIAYMEKALKGVPEEVPEAPQGVVSLRIDPDTGLRDDASRYSDWFMAEFTPRMAQDALAPAMAPGSAPARDVRNQLF
jgi:penicillin-binding protein 1A